MAIGEGANFEPRAFAVEFQRFLQSYGRLIPDPPNPVREKVAEHLGVDPSGLPSLTEKLDPAEHPNLQLALDEMSGGEWELVGLPGELRHHMGSSLVGLVGGRVHGTAATPTAVEYVSVAVGPDEDHQCVQLGIYLADLDQVPVVAMVVAPGMEQGPRQGLSLEVLAAQLGTAQDFVRHVRRLMDQKNVYRGKVLSFTFSEFGRCGLTFHRLPTIRRDDIVLPAADLEAIERHTIGMAERSQALLAAGRNLKRGLLLYGPPGTGKTLSVMYLCNRLPGRTTLLLSGPGAGALGQAMAIARNLQPSMVVLEDVDLVAKERTMPGAGTNPLLFQLLNEMDGLAADADVIFVLTTNRVELLEPALATRPGRIDQAVEVKLPDAEQRGRLFELYLRDIPYHATNLANLVAATEGVSAAFIKELIRRAVVYATEPGDNQPASLDDDHLGQALADLLTHSDPLTRLILGAGNAPDTD